MLIHQENFQNFPAFVENAFNGNKMNIKVYLPKGELVDSFYYVDLSEGRQIHSKYVSQMLSRFGLEVVFLSTLFEDLNVDLKSLKLYRNILRQISGRLNRLLAKVHINSYEY